MRGSARGPQTDARLTGLRWDAGNAHHLQIAQKTGRMMGSKRGHRLKDGSQEETVLAAQNDTIIKLYNTTSVETNKIKMILPRDQYHIMLHRKLVLT